MNKDLKYALLTVIAAGAMFVVGGRIAEWVIPKPETRILVCFHSDLRDGTVCRSLKDIIDAQQKTHSE